MATRVLIFDIWADYAHFKKYYTTTSPLTFSIPPKTTVYGVLAAIIGLDKSEYLQHFAEQCKVGIQLLRPVKKVRMGLNLIDTSKSKSNKWNIIEGRTQIRTEFLKEPAFRLYIAHENEELQKRLGEQLQNHHSYYTVTLGLSESLANFAYVGEEELTLMEDNDSFVEIVTAFRVDDGNVEKGDIDFTEMGKEYFSDKIAIEMQPDREVTDYGQVVFERNGQTIKARPKRYYQLPGGSKVLFL